MAVHHCHVSHRRPRPHLVATSRYPSTLRAPSGMTGCFVRRVGRYNVHAAVICLMAGNRAISGARNRSPAVHREPGPCIARSVHNQPADSRSFPGRRTAHAHRRTPLPGASGPHRWPPLPGSGHRCSRQLNPPPDVRLDIHAATGRVWSANFGILPAVQLHDVGGVAALWLCDADVRAAVQVHEEGCPGPGVLRTAW